MSCLLHSGIPLVLGRSAAAGLVEWAVDVRPCWWSGAYVAVCQSESLSSRLCVRLYLKRGVVVDHVAMAAKRSKAQLSQVPTRNTGLPVLSDDLWRLGMLIYDAATDGEF